MKIKTSLQSISHLMLRLPTLTFSFPFYVVNHHVEGVHQGAFLSVKNCLLSFIKNNVLHFCQSRARAYTGRKVLCKYQLWQYFFYSPSRPGVFILLYHTVVWPREPRFESGPGGLVSGTLTTSPILVNNLLIIPCKSQ